MNHHAERKMCLILALCLILTLFPSSVPASLADTPGSGYVNYNKVYFRKTPSTAPSAEYWCFLDSNWPVTVKGSVYNTFGSWYEIEASLPYDTSLTVTGYIMKRYITVTVPPVTAVPTAAPTPTPAGSQAAYVNTDKVYFRREAGYRSESWAVLPIDWPVLVTGFTYTGSVKWYSVLASVPGDDTSLRPGYIHSDYITMGTPASPTAAPTASPTPTPTPAPDPLDAFSGYALVLYNGTNVRTAADPSSTAVTALLSGQLVTFLDEGSAGMVHIRVQVIEGYIASDSLKMLTLREYYSLIDPDFTASPAPTETPTAAPTDAPVTAAPTGGATGLLSGYAVITQDGTSVHLLPDASSVSFTSLLSGELVRVLDFADSGMVHIRVQVLEGYVGPDSIRQLTQEEYNDLISGVTPAASVTSVPTQAPVTAVPTATPTPAPTPAYQVLGYIQLTKSDVNLRSTPNGASLNPSREDRLNKYTYLPYLLQPVYSGNYWWVYVYAASLNLYGYIRSDCYEFVIATPTPGPTPDPSVTDGLTVTGYLMLTATNVNLRATPNGKSLTPQDSDRIYITTPIAYYGEPVTAGGYEWAYIYYNGMLGYIRSDCYTLLSATATPVPAPTPEPSLQGYVILTSDKVNVRKTPGGTILGQAKVGTIFPCYGESVYNGETWYSVYYSSKNTYAFILSSMAENYTYVTPVPEDTGAPVTATPTPVPVITAAPVVTAAPVSAYGYVITTADKVYIRQSPTTSSRALAQVSDKGTAIITTGEAVTVKDVLWYPVTYSGMAGYISGNFTQALSSWQAEIYLSTGVVPTPSPAPVIPSDPSEYLVVTTDKVFIRTGNSYSAQSMPEMANEGDIFFWYGTSPDADGRNFLWYIIDYGGLVCYIHSNYVRVLTNSEYSSLMEEIALLTPAPTEAPTEAPSPTPAPVEGITVDPPETYRLLSLNDEGSDVTELQKALVILGHLDSGEISGTFLASTQSAVISFQLVNGLTVTGFVDEETWNTVFLPFIVADDGSAAG